MKKFSLAFISLLLIIFCSGCDKSDDDTETTDSDDGCVPEVPTGDIADGEFCMNSHDCMSGFCNTKSHVPADQDAVCETGPELGTVRAIGNLTDFITNEPIPNSTIKIGGAFDVIQDPNGFTPTETITTDEDGKFDQILNEKSAAVSLGIVAVASGDTYYPTSTGLVKPKAGCGVYPGGISNTNVKVIKTDDINELSDLLEDSYPELSDSLPIGENGATLGVIMDVETGLPVEDVSIKSDSATSTATAYYLNDDRDGFTQELTGTSGIFVIIKPGLAEEFQVYDGDKVITRNEFTAGEVKGLIFSTTAHIER